MKCPINYTLSQEDLNLCIEFSEQSALTQQDIEFGQNDIKARDVKEIARDNLIGKIAEVAFKRIIEKTIPMWERSRWIFLFIKEVSMTTKIPI